MRTIITNANIVNEGQVFAGELAIEHSRIASIGSTVPRKPGDVVVDAKGKYLLPGAIDDQVHFREPGLTHKATIHTESQAAVAGGITSFMEMPNTNPPAFTNELLEDKYRIAASHSPANYSFYIGASNDNVEEVLRTDLSKVCGLKIFMGSSTGNLLVDNPAVLRDFFSRFEGLIATHCESEPIIRANLAAWREKFGDNVDPSEHPLIRSAEACYESSSFATALARECGTRLHVLHISTAKEVGLFDKNLPLATKKITSEACIHHMWFDDRDYASKGNWIKWNPAIKTAADREAILQGVLSNAIDVIATDHAPHTSEEKLQPYFQAPSGGPLVQHSVQAMFELVKQGKITVERVVEKMSHNVAELFRIRDRGFIREGYFADLILVDPAAPQQITKSNILAKCGWSPFEGTTFSASVTHTWVNGNLVWGDGRIQEGVKGQRLEFGVHH